MLDLYDRAFSLVPFLREVSLQSTELSEVGSGWMDHMRNLVRKPSQMAASGQVVPPEIPDEEVDMTSAPGMETMAQLFERIIQRGSNVDVVRAQH